MTCSPLKTNRRFGVASQSSACYMSHADFLAWLILRPWRWSLNVSPKRRLILDKLHCVISHKIDVSATTGARTSNPTSLRNVQTEHARVRGRGGVQSVAHQTLNIVTIFMNPSNCQVMLSILVKTDFTKICKFSKYLWGCRLKGKLVPVLN
jgi:hypothetical protein